MITSWKLKKGEEGWQSIPWGELERLNCHPWNYNPFLNFVQIVSEVRVKSGEFS